MRRQFEMTPEDLAGLLEQINAARNAPLIAIHCGPVPSVQEAANAAWADLGKRMGFDGATALPTDGGPRFFTAEPIEPDEASRQALEDGERK